MNKLIGSMVSYFVLTMLLAYPWHMILFHDVYSQLGAFTRGEPIMIFGLLAIVLQAWVIAYLFPFYYRVKQGPPMWLGIKYSLMMGLMVYTVMVFATAAKFLIEPVMTFVAYGTAFQLIQFVVTGAALGWIHRKEISP